MSILNNFSEFEPEEYNPEEFTREQDEQRRQREFKDFLLVQEIAGTLRGVPHSSRIPRELLIDTGDQVQISEEFEQEESHDSATVLVHRDKQGDIASVEVVCTCGKKTMIKFRYEGAESV